jgi:DNA-directed RNA polymerase subunit RPC12/RpoP
MKTLGAKQIIAGTVKVTMTSDRSQLVGNCPTCSSRLTVELRNDGSFGNLVACMRCKEIFRVEARESIPSPGGNPCGYGVSYAVVGAWEVPSIMEYLFDNLGPVEQVAGGFVCRPDEQHADFPFITVSEASRTIRFSLFGQYQERDAASIINQVVSEFGNRFQLDLHPLLLDRWEYRDETKGFALVERRPLGTLLREGVKRQARA